MATMVLPVGALRVGQSEMTKLLSTPSTPLPLDAGDAGACAARPPSGPRLECDEPSADIAWLETADGPDGARARLLASGAAWCRRARSLRYEAPLGLARYTGGPATTPATRDGALLGGWSGEEEAIAQALVAMPSLRRGAVPALGGAAGAAPAPALAPDEQQRGPRRVNVALTFAAPATGGGEGAAVASPGAFEAAGVGTPTAAPDGAPPTKRRRVASAAPASAALSGRAGAAGELPPELPEPTPTAVGAAFAAGAAAAPGDGDAVSRASSPRSVLAVELAASAPVGITSAAAKPTAANGGCAAVCVVAALKPAA